ncbi:unnamed protein product, partial [Oppiella nova]
PRKSSDGKRVSFREPNDEKNQTTDYAKNKRIEDQKKKLIKDAQIENMKSKAIKKPINMRNADKENKRPNVEKKNPYAEEKSTVQEYERQKSIEVWEQFLEERRQFRAKKVLPFMSSTPNLSQRKLLKTKSILKKPKLPPIGQLPEYSAARKRERPDDDIEYDVEPSYLGPSTSTSPAPTPSGSGGSRLYQDIIEAQKRKNDKKREEIAKKFKTTGVIGYDRWANPKGVHKHQAYTDKPKVENWPVPKTKPFITPIDRLKIIQSRSLDNLQPSTSSATPEFLKDPNDLELNISRARSSKVLGKNIRRVEHRPTWLSNFYDYTYTLLNR